MYEELRFAIGGICLSIKWRDSRILNWPHRIYQKFLSSGEPRISLNVVCAELPVHSSPELFDGKEDGHWKLFENGSNFIIETYDTLSGEKNLICTLDTDFLTADVYMVPGRYPRFSLNRIFKRQPYWSLAKVMQPLGQILLMNVLADESGFMAHGLGINDRGRGMVFLGRSGTGKSTLAKLWTGQEGVQILSDEHILIKKKEGKYWLFGTPWPGMEESCSAEAVPLESLFFIEHAPKNTILGKGTIKNLFPLLFLPFWNKKRIEQILLQCEDLHQTLDWNRLGFVKDKSVVKFLRRF